MCQKPKSIPRLHSWTHKTAENCYSWNRINVEDASFKTPGIPTHPSASPANLPRSSFATASMIGTLLILKNGYLLLRQTLIMIQLIHHLDILNPPSEPMQPTKTFNDSDKNLFRTLSPKFDREAHLQKTSMKLKTSPSYRETSETQQAANETLPHSN